MAGDAIAPPEPQEIDETRSTELGRLSARAVLRRGIAGDEHCENCAYYLEDTADISYCWYPNVRILVGSDWWCQWWTPASEA